MVTQKTLWIVFLLAGTLLFQGWSGTLAAATPNWTQLSPSGLSFSLFRGGSTTVYDPTSNKLILLSGFSSAPPSPHVNDTWILTDANGLGGTPTWSNLIPDGAPGSPPGRHNHSAVYDSANSRMIIFGGCLGGCLPVANDVWVLINANGSGGTPTWQQLSPVGSPPPRQAHQAVYDSMTNSMIVWAGQNGGGSACGTFSDVWVLSNANGLGGTPAWTQLSPTGGPPAGQNVSSATYDPMSNVLTVFAGVGMVAGKCTVTNAVWALSHANGTGGAPVWTNLVAQGASESPANRGNTAAVYDHVSNRMIIFGGGLGSGLPTGDVWVLTNANGFGGPSVWKREFPTPAPVSSPVQSSRWNNAGFDSTNNRFIMFGGGFFEGPLWSTWVLTHANGM
jgi:hypothetical protein